MPIDIKDETTEETKSENGPGQGWGGVFAEALKAARPNLRDGAAEAIASLGKSAQKAVKDRKAAKAPAEEPGVSE